MGKKKKPTEQGHLETRRDMLQKIGLALAASTVASGPLEAHAQVAKDRPGRPIQLKGPVKLPASIQSAVKGDEGDLKIFFTTKKGGAASVLVLKASDQEAVRLARSQLRAGPATARVVDGVIQVNLGRAAEGRCNLSDVFSAVAIDFGDPPPMEIGPITRG